MLISNKADSLESLPPAARIGTGSLRRKAQLLHLRPDLVVEDIRGNVETRLRKLDEGQFDAIVLAEAGLKRLGLARRIACVIPQTTMLPAVGQGALAIEARSDDTATRRGAELRSTTSRRIKACWQSERCCLSCVPAASRRWALWAAYQGGRLVLDAVVLSPDGQRRLTASGPSDVAAAVTLGQQVAAELLQQGAAELIAASRAN